MSGEALQQLLREGRERRAASRESDLERLLREGREERARAAQRNRERVAPAMVPAAEADLRVIPAPMIEAADERVQRMHPERQARVTKSIQRSVEGAKEIRKSAAKTIAASRRVAMTSEDPDEKARATAAADRLEQSLWDSVKTGAGAIVQPYRDIGNMAATGGKWVLDALDAPHKAVRAGETALRTGKPFDWSTAPDQGAWTRAMREAAAQGSGPHQVLTGVADQFGAIPGSIIGANAAGVSLMIDLASAGDGPGLSDLVRGTRPRTRGEILRSFPQDLERSKEDWTKRSGDFLMSMATDPTTYIGTGAAKSVGQRAVPVLRRAIAGSPWAKRLAKVDLDALFKSVDAGLSVEDAALVPERFRAAVAGQLQAAGLKADDAMVVARDLFEKAYGKGLRYFHAARPELTVPFTGRGLDLGAVVGDYKVRRAVDFGLDKAKSRFGVPDEFVRIAGEQVPMSRVRDAAEMIRRAGVGYRQYLDQTTRAMLGKVAESGVDPKRQRELLRSIIDPDLPADIRQPVKLLDEALKSAQERAQAAAKAVRTAKKAKDAEGLKGSLAVLDEARQAIASLDASKSQMLGPAKAAYDEALKALPANERLWVDEVDKFLKSKLADLRRAGFSVGDERNRLSGRYFPRRFRGEVRPFETATGDRGVNHLTPRKGDLALGAFDDEGRLASMPFLRAQMDPGEALIDYAGRANAVIAKRRNAEKAASLFGLSEEEARRHRLDHNLARGWVALDTKEGRRYVPRTMMALADVAVAGSAAEAMRWAKQFLDESGLIKVYNFWQHGVMSRVKSNLLTRNLKFHLLNGINDILQLMGAGMSATSMAGSFTAARRALKNPQAKFKFAGREWTGAELRNLAQQHGLPVGVDYGARVDVANAGRNLKEVYNRVSRTTAGVPTVRDRIYKWRTENPLAAITAPKRGEAYGKWWEETTRLGAFMWRLKQGDSPARASQYTLRTLIDYGDSWGQTIGGQLLRAARSVMPFVNWTAKAPGMATRIALRAPRAVLAPDRAVHAATAGPHVELGTPEWVDERATSSVLRPEQQQLVRKVERLIGGAWGQPGLGSEGDAGVETRMVNRLNPYGEAWNILAAPVNLDLIWQMLGPLTQAAHETRTGEDFFSRRQMEPALPSIKGSQLRLPLFNAGTGNLVNWPGMASPQVPEWVPGIGGAEVALEAVPDQASLIGRYMAPVLMSTQMQHLVNRAAYPYTGRTAILGKERPVGALPEDQLNRTSLNMLLPAPLVDVMPDADLLNQLRQLRISRGRQGRQARDLTPQQ